jgi:hypothetical protein
MACSRVQQLLSLIMELRGSAYSGMMSRALARSDGRRRVSFPRTVCSCALCCESRKIYQAIDRSVY